MFFAASDTQS